MTEVAKLPKKLSIKDVAKTNGIDAELLALERFNQRLNTPPPKEEIKENKFADNAKYLPISFVQMTLDEMYFGLWETVNFTKQVIVNEIVGSVELRVFHPVIKQWITKTGVAATPIRLVKDSEVTDVSAKIKNALTQDAPHLLADCIKNAAKQLGKRFGRDLNRKFEDTYNPMVLPVAQKMLLIETVKAECDECKNMVELTKLFNDNPAWQSNKDALDIFTARKKELS